MKLKTISGETLRAQFTDFECHALKHAAAHCQTGETFTGIPTSSNPKYMGSAETFTVIENNEESVTIRREKTGLCLTACKCEGSTPRATRKPDRVEVGTWPCWRCSGGYALPLYCCGDGCPYYQVGLHGMAAHDSGPALWITCHVHPEDGRRGYTLNMASVVGGALV